MSQPRSARRGEVQMPCPDCGQLLVVRRNRESGDEFLGCIEYPRCAHTVQLPAWFRLMRAGATMLPGLEMNTGTRRQSEHKEEANGDGG